jgi:hypothetical protein
MTITRRMRRPAEAGNGSLVGPAPTVAEIKAFLTAESPREKAIVETSRGRPFVSDGRINDHTVALFNLRNGEPAEKAKLNDAPNWLKEAALDLLKTHRLAKFDLPAPHRGHTLWFLETNTYRAGWFLDHGKHPVLVNQPGVFREGKPNEDLWAPG